MKLSSVLNEDTIFLSVKGNNRKEIYENMLKAALSEIEESINVKTVAEAIMEREDTTGMIYDKVAFPHVRIEEISDLYVIIGKLEKPIKLLENDEAETQLVILSLISPTSSDIYLKTISAFAKFLRAEDNVKALLAAKNAEGFKDILDTNKVKIKNEITAEDLMSTETFAVCENDSLSVALDIFNREKLTILPVVDANGKLSGVIEATSVIKKFLPEYIFMMDNLNFLNSFEAFDAIFKNENVESVKKFMIKPRYTCNVNTPLIQITVAIARDNLKAVFIVDEDKKLLGKVSVKNIIHKVLRG